MLHQIIDVRYLDKSRWVLPYGQSPEAAISVFVALAAARKSRTCSVWPSGGSHRQWGAA
jgi:hypothetical protein